MEKCKYADKYKAKFPPKCGPCDFCRNKWEKSWEKPLKTDRDQIVNLLKDRPFNIKIY